MRVRQFWFLFLVVAFGGMAGGAQLASVGTAAAHDLFPANEINTVTLVLEQRGDEADVYFPDVSAGEDAFPIVAVLQGGRTDKQFYTEFGRELARFGFVVVIPNHFQVLGPPGTPPTLAPDQFVVLDVLAQMQIEDADPASPLLGIVDTTRMGLTGHSVGGVVGLLVLEGSCNPPFCFGFFPRPEAVQAGAFYATNTCFFGGPIPDPRCEPGENLIDVETNGFPAALVQGLLDGRTLPAEAEATFERILDGPRELITIAGANHYSINDLNNPPGTEPDPNDPTIFQPESVQEIAQAMGQFLRTTVTPDNVELIPGTFPLFSNQMNIGNDVTMNGHTVSKGKTGGNSVVDVQGNRDTVSQELPALDPPFFPSNNSSIKVTDADSPFSSVNEVFFKEVKITKEGSATFSGGGPFHVDQLKVEKGATINLEAGTYFINKLEMKQDDARINIVSRPVALHIGNKFGIHGKRVVINRDGSVIALRVFLHHNAELKIKKELDFTGVVYGPDGKKVELEGTTFRGAIITNGDIKLKKQVAITYTEADQEAVNDTIILP